MSGPKLQRFVCVDGPNGMRQFGPDDEVPGWALALITNPDAWEDGLPDLPDDPDDDHVGAEDGESVPGSEDGEPGAGDDDPEAENPASALEPEPAPEPAAPRRRSRPVKKADDGSGDAS